VTDADTLGAECVDARGRESFKDIHALKNYVCLSPSDAGVLLSRCRQGFSFSGLDFCVVDDEFPGLICKEVDPRPFPNNFSCMSPDDTRRVLEYCKLKRERK
jgi:hypothetical protein